MTTPETHLLLLIPLPGQYCQGAGIYTATVPVPLICICQAVGIQTLVRCYGKGQDAVGVQIQERLLM